MGSHEWITVESRGVQLVFIEQFAKIECGVTFEATVLTELFEFTRSRVPAIRATAQGKQRPRIVLTLCPMNTSSSYVR
jgi:hypothetical protein